MSDGRSPGGATEEPQSFALSSGRSVVLAGLFTVLLISIAGLAVAGVADPVVASAAGTVDTGDADATSDQRTRFYGTVTDNRTGEPLTDAEIRITDNGTGAEVAAVETDPEGYYQTDLDPGRYDVVVWAPGYNASIEHNVSVSGIRTAHHVSLDPLVGADSIPLYEISGAVRDVQTRLGLSTTVQLTLVDPHVSEETVDEYVEANERVLERAGLSADVERIVRRQNRLFNGTTVTVNTTVLGIASGMGGDFLVEGLPAGEYTVAVPDTASHHGNATNVTLGPASQNVEFLLYPRQGSVEADLWLELPEGMDADRVPADDVTKVRLERLNVSGEVTWSSEQVTLTDGHVQRGNLTPATGLDLTSPFPGTYRLRVSRPGYEVTTANFTVGPDEDVDLGDVVLRINGTETRFELRGTEYTAAGVSNADGPEDYKPIPNATVILNGTSVGSTYIHLERSTNGSGTVRFTDVPPGSYNYTITETTVEDDTGEVRIVYPKESARLRVGHRNRSAADPPSFYPTHNRRTFVAGDGYTTVYHPRHDPIKGSFGGHFVTYGEPFFPYVSAEYLRTVDRTTAYDAELMSMEFTASDVLTHEEIDLNVTVTIGGDEYRAPPGRRLATNHQGVLDNSTLPPGHLEFTTTEDPRFQSPYEVDEALSSNGTVSLDPPLEPSADYVYGVVHMTNGNTSRLPYDRITEEGEGPNAEGLLEFNFADFDTFGMLSGVNVTLVDQETGEEYYAVTDEGFDGNSGHFDVGWVPANRSFTVTVDTSDSPYTAATDDLGTIETEGGAERAFGLRVPVESQQVNYDVSCTDEDTGDEIESRAQAKRTVTPFVTSIPFTHDWGSVGMPVSSPERTWWIYAADHSDYPSGLLKWEKLGIWPGLDPVEYTSSCSSWETSDLQTASLEGWVYDAERWEGIEGATVTHAASGAQATTNESGYYRIDDIDSVADSHTITVDHPHLLDTIEYEMDLSPGINRLDPYVRKDAASIQGTVERPTEFGYEPVEGMTVVLHSDEFGLADNGTIRTDENGEFELTVTPGEGNLTLQLLGEASVDGELTPHYPVNVTTEFSLDAEETKTLDRVVTEPIPAEPAFETRSFAHVVDWELIPFSDDEHVLGGVTEPRWRDPQPEGLHAFVRLEGVTAVDDDVSAPEISGPGETKPAFGPGIPNDPANFAEFIEHNYSVDSGRFVVEAVDPNAANGDGTELINTTLFLEERFDHLRIEETGFLFELTNLEPMYDASGTQIRDYRATITLSNSHGAPKQVDSFTFSEEGIHVNDPSWVFQLAEHANDGTGDIPIGNPMRNNDGVAFKPFAKDTHGARVEINYTDGLAYEINMTADLTKSVGTNAEWGFGEFDLGLWTPVEIRHRVGSDTARTTATDIREFDRGWFLGKSITPTESSFVHGIVQQIIPLVGAIQTHESRQGEWSLADEYELAPHREGPPDPVYEAVSVEKAYGGSVNLLEPVELVKAVATIYSGGLGAIPSLALPNAEIGMDTEQAYNWSYYVEPSVGDPSETAGWPFDRLEPTAPDPKFTFVPAQDVGSWRESVVFSPPFTQGGVFDTGWSVDANLTWTGQWGTDPEGKIGLTGCQLRSFIDFSVELVGYEYTYTWPSTNGIQGLAHHSCSLGTSGRIHVTPYNETVQLTRGWVSHPSYAEPGWEAGQTSGTVVEATDPSDAPALQALGPDAALLTFAHDTADDPTSVVPLASRWNAGEATVTDPSILFEGDPVVDTAMADAATNGPLVVATQFAAYDPARTRADTARISYVREANGSWTDPVVISDGNYSAREPAVVQGPDGVAHVVWRATLTGRSLEPAGLLRYARWDGESFSEPTTVFEGSFAEYDLTLDDGEVALSVLGGTTNGSAVRTLRRTDSGWSAPQQVAEIDGRLGHHLAVAPTDGEPVHTWVRTESGGTVLETGTVDTDPAVVTTADTVTAVESIATPWGRPVLVWAADDGQTSTVRLRWFENGTWTDETTVTTADTRITGLSLAPLAEGGLFSSGQTATGELQIAYSVRVGEDAEAIRLHTESIGSGPSPVVGDTPPRDLNDDGLYEDVNGDETFDIFDVQVLFNNLDSDPVQSNPAAFNFDGDANADVNIFDVQALFNDLQAATATRVT